MRAWAGPGSSSRDSIRGGERWVLLLLLLLLLVLLVLVLVLLLLLLLLLELLELLELPELLELLELLELQELLLLRVRVLCERSHISPEKRTACLASSRCSCLQCRPV